MIMVSVAGSQSRRTTEKKTMITFKNAWGKQKGVLS